MLLALRPEHPLPQGDREAPPEAAPAETVHLA